MAAGKKNHRVELKTGGKTRGKTFIDDLNKEARRETDELRSQQSDELGRIQGALPRDFEEARRRYLRWRRQDPFPDIPSALLHCSAFCDYVIETGMLHPFHPNTESLKLASYQFPLMGDYVYWDENEKHRLSSRRCS